jgi:hypothetical protein
MLNENPAAQNVSSRAVDGGYIEGTDTPQGFQMTRLCSTNPALYLKKEYAPGSILDKKGHL